MAVCNSKAFFSVEESGSRYVTKNEVGKPSPSFSLLETRQLESVCALFQQQAYTSAALKISHSSHRQIHTCYDDTVLLVARYLRVSLTITNTHVGDSQPRYGKGGASIAHKASSYPLALSIFHPPLTVTQLRLADILRAVYSFPHLRHTRTSPEAAAG
jgi:hypothetical protein